MILSNYITTSWRHMMKNKLFSAINLFGLAIGLMSCMLIVLFVRSEMGYDTQWKDSDRIYRLHSAFHAPDREPFITVRSAGKMKEAYKNFAPEVIEEGVRFLNRYPTLIRENGDAFDEKITFVDREFFDMFDLPLIKGSLETAFNDILNIVISRDQAIKYFGTVDALGKTITLCCIEGKELELKVSGVFENLTEMTHMNFNILSPIEESMFDYSPGLLNTFTSVNTYTYFKVHEGKTADDLQARINDWTNTKSPFRQNSAFNIPVDTPVTDIIKPTVMNIEDIHLHAYEAAGSMGDVKALGDINMLYTFTAVAIMVLVIASINFMNLSTARASQRAREVALRKVLGASRKQVASQFLGEAVVMSMAAFVIALAGVELVLPAYSDILMKDLSLSLTEDIGLTGSFALLSLFIGLLSGLYPAAILSRFLPASVLKANKSSSAEGSNGLRSFLVVFQFAISIGLVVCTGVVYGQTLYAKTMNPGFSYDNKLIVGGIGRGGIAENIESLRQQLESIPEVTSVVFSTEAPSQDWQNSRYLDLLDSAGVEGKNISKILNNYTVDYGYFEAYGITPLAGRSFNRDRGTDMWQDGTREKNGSGGIILNESAARDLGFSYPKDAIGRMTRARGMNETKIDLEIIGVIPDIYYRSIRFGIRSSMYFLNSDGWRVATVSYKTNNLENLISDIESKWRGIAPQVPFNYQHLSEMMENQYAKEAGQATLFAAFSALAIIIACLGLYGLASFTAERRTKEIGIRKILGARGIDIIRLLVWQFSKPVIIANIIAWPVASYYMLEWLSGFEYRITDAWVYGLCAIAGGIALIIAWVTVASHAARVARTNPIKALRYE